MERLTEPRNFQEWGARAVRWHVLLVGALLVAVAGAELQLHWIEHALGSVLVATNAERPESGAIWEKGRKAQSARSTVDRMLADRDAFQRTARNAGDLNEVVASLSPGQGAMLSAEHFRELYQKIPPGSAAELISVFDLLRLASEGRWSRTYLEKSSDGLVVYLLEPNNHVVRQLKVSDATLALLARRTAAVNQGLEELAGFQNRIYPAERFFAALSALQEDERRALVSQPERLLEVSGQITRVGISDEALSGYVDLGFEARAGSQSRVLLLQGADWAVWRLREVLEGKTPSRTAARAPDSAPSESTAPARTPGRWSLPDLFRSPAASTPAPGGSAPAERSTPAGKGVTTQQRISPQ
jgi:hypothetical protein